MFNKHFIKKKLTFIIPFYQKIAYRMVIRTFVIHWLICLMCARVGGVYFPANLLW